MAISKSDALKAILNSLSTSSGDIEASAVVSTDGLMIASNFPAGLDEDRLAAMSAALLAMGERTAFIAHMKSTLWTLRGTACPSVAFPSREPVSPSLENALGFKRVSPSSAARRSA